VEFREDYAQESRLRFEGLPEEIILKQGQQTLPL
jgi:hypothetical protein